MAPLVSCDLREIQRAPKLKASAAHNPLTCHLFIVVVRHKIPSCKSQRQLVQWTAGSSAEFRTSNYLCATSCTLARQRHVADCDLLEPLCFVNFLSLEIRYIAQEPHCIVVENRPTKKSDIVVSLAVLWGCHVRVEKIECIFFSRGIWGLFSVRA